MPEKEALICNRWKILHLHTAYGQTLMTQRDSRPSPLQVIELLEADLEEEVLEAHPDQEEGEVTSKPQQQDTSQVKQKS